MGRVIKIAATGGYVIPQLIPRRINKTDVGSITLNVLPEMRIIVIKFNEQSGIKQIRTAVIFDNYALGVGIIFQLFGQTGYAVFNLNLGIIGIFAVRFHIVKEGLRSTRPQPDAPGSGLTIIVGRGAQLKTDITAGRYGASPGNASQAIERLPGIVWRGNKFLVKRVTEKIETDIAQLRQIIRILGQQRHLVLQILVAGTHHREGSGKIAVFINRIDILPLGHSGHGRIKCGAHLDFYYSGGIVAPVDRIIGRIAAYILDSRSVLPLLIQAVLEDIVKMPAAAAGGIQKVALTGINQIGAPVKECRRWCNFLPSILGQRITQKSIGAPGITVICGRNKIQIIAAAGINKRRGINIRTHK